MCAQNLYTPSAIVSELNAIKSISAEFLDHQSSRRPFFGDWTSLLKKYFKSMPPNYTGNYLFEINQGIVSMHHLVNTPDNEAVQFLRILILFIKRFFSICFEVASSPLMTSRRLTWSSSLMWSLRSG
jgi:hypothetical protein